MHRVGLSSPSLSGISPEEQVFRKTSSIMRFGNLALSDHKVTVTAERQPPLEWRGGGEASACELGDRKISIALNEEPEPQWGNSITAPLRRSEPSGDVQHSLRAPIGWVHPWHGPWRAARPCHPQRGGTSVRMSSPSTVVAPKQFAEKAQGILLSL